MSPVEPELWAAVGRGLLHSTWIVAGLAAAHRVLVGGLSRASARLRHALALGFLAAAVVLPVAVAVSTLGPDGPILAVAAEPGATAAGPRAATEPRSADVADFGATAPAERVLAAALPWIARLWTACVSLLLARLVLGQVAARRWTRTRVAAPPGDWDRRFAELATRLGLDRRVALLRSLRVDVPCVVGILKPVVLVPTAAFHHLAPEHLEAILAHELAHVRRWDPVVRVVQDVAEALLFFHPAARWLAREADRAREAACDDLAVEVTGDPRPVAAALASLEGLRPLPGSVGAADGELLARIRRLLEPPKVSDRTAAPGTAALATVLVLAAALGGAAWTALPEPAVASDAAVPSALQITLRLEVMEVDPAVLPVLPFGVDPVASADPIWEAFDEGKLRQELDRLRELHGDDALRVVSAPRVTTLEDVRASVQTGLAGPAGNRIVELALTPRALDGGFEVDLDWRVTDTRSDRDEVPLLRVPMTVARDEQLLVSFPDPGVGGIRYLARLEVEALAPRSAARVDWIGAPISLSLKDADLRDAFAAFARITGRRIFVATDVRGSVTVELHDVPAGQALEQVLRINCLALEPSDLAGSAWLVRPAGEGDAPCSDPAFLDSNRRLLSSPSTSAPRPRPSPSRGP